MMGVITNPSKERSVREFFELFKTPWEFYRAGEQYDVVLCAGDTCLDGIAAKIVLLYAGEKTAFDEERDVPIETQQEGALLSFRGNPVPIYGNVVTFGRQAAGALLEKGSGQSVAYVGQDGDSTYARVGYDLFAELQTLLSKGQPAVNAAIPTLELHIAVLRDLIAGSGVPLFEIPPVPDGYSFIACLTHDVDHASIRRHKFDPTMFGFLYRATVGSLVALGRGRLSLRQLFTNLAAAVKLPFVYLGVARDFWLEFDRYLELEKNKPSTFFIIPFERHPGRTTDGSAPAARASRYDISHIAGKIPRLMAAGCEIGLHGLDAWIDSSRGREEAARISRFAGVPDGEIGVRMHWLYRNDETPVTLEEAGFSYDSTVGYNETVGYRAGTTQVFKPLQATQILELPLHVMDTALFYPSHLNLSPIQARERLATVLDNSCRYGGVLTINWHDRSMAPERLWGDFYKHLLDELTLRGAWFCTAAQAVSWFRMRRAAVFQKGDHGGSTICVTVPADSKGPHLPKLRLRCHPAREFEVAQGINTNVSQSHNDRGLNGSIDVHCSN